MRRDRNKGKNDDWCISQETISQRKVSVVTVLFPESQENMRRSHEAQQK